MQEKRVFLLCGDKGSQGVARLAAQAQEQALLKEVGEEYKAQWTEFKKVYVDLARRYPAGWKPLELDPDEA